MILFDFVCRTTIERRSEANFLGSGALCARCLRFFSFNDPKADTPKQKMLNQKTFLYESLSLPANVLSYEAGRRLSAYAAPRYVREINLWSFAVQPFAEDGRCSYAPIAESHQQIPNDGHHKGQLTYSTQNAWHRVVWEGHSMELVAFQWSAGYSTEDRVFLIAPSEAIADDFVRVVCAWNEEVRAEILVFHEGSWFKDEELYQATQDVRFDDIVLPPSLAEALQRDLWGFFHAQEQYEHYKIPWKRGVLLYGPPGNGKTHAIKAILNTVQKPRLYVKSFESGCCTAHENMRRVFERAREVSPCVLIFEDLDSLLNDKNRSFFLNELDGFSSNHGILALATTNHIERLDVALVKRPSRFDRKYLFDIPGYNERLRYIGRWNDRLEPALRVDLSAQTELASQTDGFSYAFIKELFVSGIMAWIQQAEDGAMHTVLREQCALLREQIHLQDTDNSPKDSE